MSRRDNYIISKANYSLRKKHLDTSVGTIIEEDYSTIQPMEGLFSDDEYAFPESIFKFKVAAGVSARKRHTRGGWESWVNGGESGNTWTSETNDEAPITDESKIVLKPNYTSISDFACYGSAYSLIEGSINDIHERFPGSLILTTNEFNNISKMDDNDNVVTEILPLLKYDGTWVSDKLYLISNENDIDIDSNLTNSDDVINPLRYLSLSQDKYTDADGNPFTYEIVDRYEGKWCDETIVAEINLLGYTIYVYYNDGKKILLCNGSVSENKVLIKPTEDTIEEFFDNLDDFEKVLLNRETNPIYKASFETVSTSERGNEYSTKGYVWPVLSDGVSLDFSSAAFSTYLGKLLKLAEWHDSFTSDNIWRSMTHTSLKNLDWTFFRDKDGEIDDLSTIDNTRLSMIARLYGRSYDDLMRNANNIKYCNSVTYNEKNNIPDYFLSDVTEIEGWELTNVTPISDNTIETKILYSGYTKGNTGYEANIDFMRRLKLNSSYINSLKGTRRGLTTLLGMFGYDENKDYVIQESIAVAKPKEGSYLDYNTVMEYNSMKDTESPVELLYEPLLGIPVARIETTDIDYVIPWFDKDKDYDGNIYFQMKGGWGKANEKTIHLDISDVTKLENSYIYGETLQYMKFSEDIDGMLSFPENEIKDGDICYVTDTTDITGYTGTLSSDYSHYFILERKLYSTTLGFNTDSGCWGWRNIAVSEYDGSNDPTENGKKILYLESIVNTEKGNNPHCGYGEYDDGEEYLEYFRKLFKYSLENDKFSNVEDDVVKEIEEVGFDVLGNITDDKKVHWFEDSEEIKRKENEGTNIKELILDKSTQIYSEGENDKEINDDIVNLLENREKADETFYENLYNYEDGDNTDEAAANSVINVKNLFIRFYANDIELEEEKEYFVNVVLPYVEQVIPSTTIFRYDIVQKNPVDCTNDDGTGTGGGETPGYTVAAVIGDTVESEGVMEMAQGIVDGVVVDTDDTAIILEDTDYDEVTGAYTYNLCEDDSGIATLGKDNCKDE